MKKTVEMALVAEPNRSAAMGFSFTLRPLYWTAWGGDIDCGPVLVSYDQPEDLTINKLREKAIEGLQKEQKAVREKADNEIDTLQKRIDSLLVLEYKPEESS